MMRLRVAHVVLSLDPGGTEGLVIDLVHRLAPHVDLRVYCLDGSGARAGEVRDAGMPVDVVGRRPGFDLRVAARLRRAIARDKIDVLHCHQYTPFVYGSLAVLGGRTSVVFTEHGRFSDAPPSPRRRAANQILGRLPARMFAVSDNLRQFMADEGLPARRIGVIHNGIDARPHPTILDRDRARTALGLHETDFVAGTAARLDPVKDLQTMIKALAIVRRRRAAARLVIAGDGAERPRLEHAAAALGLDGAVQFLGYRADVRDLLPAFDVYINSSITEGISVTILEAMAAALPVVATRVGGTPEAVAEGMTGVLVPSRNPAALADAVIGLAADWPIARALGDAGRARVLADFNAERMAARYLAVYRDAARPHR